MNSVFFNEEIRQAFLSGLLTTLWISILSAGLAIGIGFFMSFARLSSLSWVRGLATAYVEVFRNTPLLIQLYFFYRGLPAVGIQLSPEVCGILGLSLYTGSYITEIFRAGILALPKEQLENGITLGFSRFEVYRFILIPQAVRIILPPLGSQLISLMKNSSLLFYITVQELFQVIYNGAAFYFKPLEFAIIGAGLYMAMALTISLLVFIVDKVFQRFLMRFLLPGPMIAPISGGKLA